MMPRGRPNMTTRKPLPVAIAASWVDTEKYKKYYASITVVHNVEPIFKSRSQNYTKLSPHASIVDTTYFRVALFSFPRRVDLCLSYLLAASSSTSSPSYSVTFLEKLFAKVFKSCISIKHSQFTTSIHVDIVVITHVDYLCVIHSELYERVFLSNEANECHGLVFIYLSLIIRVE